MKQLPARGKKGRRIMIGLAFIAPALLFFSVFSVYPILKALSLSVMQADVFGSEFVGLRNFKEFLSSRIFWLGVKNTLRFTAFTVPVATFAPLIVALIIARATSSFQTFVRLAFYIPELSAGVIIAGLWKWLLHPNGGLLNSVLGTRIAWLGSNPYAFYSLEAILLSTVFSLPLILYLGQVITIDDQYYEAALLDGCGWVRAAWHISVPLLMPLIGFVAIIKTIAVLQVWMLPYIYTGGGPNYGTTTVVLQIYQNLTFGRWGYASAMGLFLLLVTGGLALIQRRIFK